MTRSRSAFGLIEVGKRNTNSKARQLAQSGLRGDARRVGPETALPLIRCGSARAASPRAGAEAVAIAATAGGRLSESGLPAGRGDRPYIISAGAPA